VKSVTVRIIAGVGVLAAGLLIGPPAVVPALAQNGESVDSEGGTDGSPASGGGVGVQSAPGSDGSAEPGVNSDPGESDRPTSTIGDGRNNVVDTNAAITVGDRPSTGEVRPSPKFDPLLVPFISLNEFLRALQPKPKPAPSPTFRIQQEAPVIDAAPSPGGGSEPTAASADTPRSFHVPLVAAPRLPGPPRLERMILKPMIEAPPSASAPAAVTPPSTVGARTGVIRGSLPPTGEAAPLSRSIPAGNGQSVRAYPRLRTPTMGELSLVALPGVAGLMVLTLSGGVIGYRQANSARYLRASSASRFLES
jgi:hypothetical protein